MSKIQITIEDMNEYELELQTTFNPVLPFKRDVKLTRAEEMAFTIFEIAKQMNTNQEFWDKLSELIEAFQDPINWDSSEQELFKN